MTNVGPDKDSEKRQRLACQTFAAHNGYKIAREFYDPSVSGADPIDTRPGFAQLLQYVRSKNIQAILVEDATRFARDLAVQLAGHDLLKREGIDLIPVNAPDHFTDDTPTAILVRQVLGAISQFEKAQLVAKLRAARDRKSAELGRRCEGIKGYRETNPEYIVVAKSLSRHIKRKLSLRQIAREMADRGMLTRSGKIFTAEQIRQFLR